MNVDFVHCNHCGRTPTPNEPARFFFTSCGHILCFKCVCKDANPREAGTACSACQKPAKVHEINRTLPAAAQNYFRDPKSLAAYYMQNIRTVHEFQREQRARYQKLMSAKMSKQMKCAKMELQKRAEREQNLASECDVLRASARETTHEVKRLKTEIEELQKENQQLKGQQGTPANAHRPSLNGVTPLTTLSFVGCVTSTPINNRGFPQNPYLQAVPRVRPRENERRGSAPTDMDFFSNLEDGVDDNEAIVAGGSGNAMTTPMMLGLAKR